MIHAFYQLLARFGYDHPVHPIAAHVTIGVVIAVMVFGLISLIFGRPRLKLTAWHNAVLATISVVPTALFGYMDWREKMNGQWMAPIVIKMILAGALFIILLIALFLGNGRQVETAGFSRGPWRSPRAIVALCLYVVCFAIVTALGYYGASLVY
ncbi:MAG TPA: DUF2231 domain-containing protein [Spirochaetia bacterium]|nr:DUF2231 domain-containing protein [Spirochaetia bacterium]